jgi:hypothetical protein
LDGVGIVPEARTLWNLFLFLYTLAALELVVSVHEEVIEVVARVVYLGPNANGPGELEVKSGEMYFQSFDQRTFRTLEGEGSEGNGDAS